ncbi:hypothetical protein LPJ53_000332 [Coemansia erecta]|uniref:C2H2-type domain-containing protein n=1 Tax=Coemansia erecta TaxID=147472 RepID=A0A9W8CW37_9FUNG|nr:hypothetical protein LPJ53_000332 [Coemansia erecta]
MPPSIIPQHRREPRAHTTTTTSHPYRSNTRAIATTPSPDHHRTTTTTTKMEVIVMPPPSQVYLCKLCYSEYTNIHSARNHMCHEHCLNLSTADTWGYVNVTTFS